MSWCPHPGAQTEFLCRSEFEVLFGGSAGPGKTDCLVAGLTRDVANPNYRALLIRRTFPQLQEIIDRCWRLYSKMGANYRATEKRWQFPAGAVIDLGHMQHEDDKYNYQGKEYHRAGVDELTQFSETQYTYLMSRLRTTDDTIRPQILSTTNPGGPGHYWVKERFVTITDHKRTYTDPKTGLTRVFIPATIEDNPTLFLNDPAYLSRLEALPEVERMRLRHGIWDAFEGQVFTELSQRLHGCEDFEIPPEWERFCVFDWGYAKPFSVGWYAMDYDGVLYRYREWYGCKKEVHDDPQGADEGLKMQAWEVGKGILERENGEKIRMRIADPSIWHPRPQGRQGESLGVTIHEDMARQGVYFMKADNDRKHGKMQVHKRLQIESEIDPETGEVISERPMVKVFNSCKGFWRTLPAMREDPKNPDDVDCWIAGTMVATPYGEKAIECFVVGDEVETPIGPRRVLKTYLSGMSETIRVELSNGKVIEGTPRHKVYVRSAGLVSLSQLQCNDIVIGELPAWLQRLLFIAASNTVAQECGGTTRRVETLLPGAERPFIDKSGSIVMDRSQMDTIFITRIMTSTITQLKTLSACLLVPMHYITTLIVMILSRSNASGRIVERENGLFAKISRRLVRTRQFAHLRAGIVESLLRLDTQLSNSAREDVKRSQTLLSARSVRSAVIGLLLNRILTKRLRPARIVAVGRSDERKQVFNLTIDEAHLFYANGVLSSNTDQEDHIYDDFRYMCMARPVKPKKVDRIPVGSFMHERNKLIRAKKYASRHGVNVDVAYGRVR